MSFPWDIISLLEWKIISVYIRKTPLHKMRTPLHEKSSTLFARNTTTHKRDQIHISAHLVNFISQSSLCIQSYQKKKGMRMTVYFWLLFQNRVCWATCLLASLASTMARKIQKGSWSQTGTYWIRFSTKIFTCVKVKHCYSSLSYPNKTEIYYPEATKYL